MPRQLSLRTKIILAALVISGAAIATFTAIAALLENRSFLHGVDEKLKIAARSVPYVLPPGYHAGITGKESISPALFEQAQQALTAYANANDLAYVYTYVEHDGAFYTASSSENDHDLDTGEVAYFFQPYERPPPEVFIAWKTNRPRIAEYEDEFGDFRSIFIPMHSVNADGSPGRRYLIGSDVYVEYIDTELLKTVALFVAIGLVIFGIVYLAGRPMLVRLLIPIGKLTDSTCELIEGEFRLSDEHRATLAAMASAQRDEIGQLAHAFEEMVKRLEIYIEDLKTVTAAKERIESEMKIAGDIQQSFLPQAYSPTNQLPLDLHAVLHPAKQVGGDLYDFFHLEGDRLFFAIGDVSDKGMPAALFMAVTLTLLRTLIKHDATPDHLLAATNRSLTERNEAYQFVTMFCGVLDIRTGEVHYAHGGHNPPYVAGNGALRSLTPVSGMALGAFPTAEYKTERLILAPGEILFLYTDGITEAMNLQRELYGEERLEACLKSVGANDTAQAVTAKIGADVARYVGEAPQSDDITMLCIRFRSGPGVV